MTVSVGQLPCWNFFVKCVQFDAMLVKLPCEGSQSTTCNIIQTRSTRVFQEHTKVALLSLKFLQIKRID